MELYLESHEACDIILSILIYIQSFCRETVMPGFFSCFKSSFSSDDQVRTFKPATAARSPNVPAPHSVKIKPLEEHQTIVKYDAMKEAGKLLTKTITPDFVSAFLEKLIHTNHSKSLSPAEVCTIPPENIFTGTDGRKMLHTLYVSSALPGISLKKYLERFAIYCEFTSEQWICMLVLLERYTKATPLDWLHDYNIHRLITTSLTIVGKQNDHFFKNASYAKIGGICVQELNQLERDFLTAIEYKAHVTAAEFHKKYREYLSQENPSLLSELSIFSNILKEEDDLPAYCKVNRAVPPHIKRTMQGKRDFIPIDFRTNALLSP